MPRNKPKLNSRDNWTLHFGSSNAVYILNHILVYKLYYFLSTYCKLLYVYDLF